MKKLHLSLATSFAFLAGFILLGGCSGPSSSTSDDETYEISFSKTSIVIDTYEAEAIEVNNPSNKEVTYSCSDEDIAKIVDNQVVGVSEGETTLTATINENSKASVTVYVSQSASIPFLEVEEDSVSVFIGSSYTVLPEVIFQGTSMEATFTYTVIDSEIATVTNDGTIEGHGYGDTEITINATYLGFTGNDLPSLKRTIPVHVSEDIIIEIDADNKELTTQIITVGGKTYTNEALITGTISIGGNKESIEGKSLTFLSSDTSVASLEGNKIIAHSFGTCTIMAQYESSLGTYLSNAITINVDKPNIEIEDAIYDIDLSSPSFDFFDDIKVGDTETIDEIIVSETNQTLLPSEVGNYDTLGKQKWILESADFKYSIDVICCSKIIQSASELRALTSYAKNLSRGSNGIVSFEGYFILGNDIDMNKQAFLKTVSPDFGATSVESGGFIGTFDGRGHCVSNALVSADNGGLFGTINKASIIKNVHFKDASVTGRSGLISSYCGGTIENCFIEGTITGNGVVSSQKALLASVILSSADINHCIVNYQNADVELDYASAIGTLNGAKEGNFDSVYVLNTSTKVIGTEVAQEYATFSSSSNGQYVTYEEFYSNADVSDFDSHWLFGPTEITFG